MYAKFYFSRKSGSLGVREISFNYDVSCSNNKAVRNFLNTKIMLNRDRYCFVILQDCSQQLEKSESCSSVFVRENKRA